LVNVLGYDIGGANTKAAFISLEDGKLLRTKIAVEYFPVWKNPENLAYVLSVIRKKLGARGADAVGVTMTAELSDVYQTKRVGVKSILSSVKEAFSDSPLFVLNTEVSLQSFDKSIQEPLSVAAANWAATGWLVADKMKNAIVVDVGSTTTSIIPIIDSKVVSQGKTDLEKLKKGELVYTGSLRTNIAAIVQSIPFDNDVASVSSELFALSGDVHLILGHISKESYSSETADGRGKTVHDALARLARVVCADTEMLAKREIVEIAVFIYKQQVNQIAYNLNKVFLYAKSLTSEEIPIVVTGLGKDFLARKAAEKIKDSVIVDLVSLLPRDAVLATPAFGVALMTAREIEGESNK
jgi:(4-(4-[2-(gamma-L-glutamylamino)ethyl]phenoxymethyl)furan-2-yl)methanamine synthase